jgi:hypothetical protein
MRAYWRPGSRCCCSGCRRCSCCAWQSEGSSDCCSRSPRATPGGRGRARLPLAAGRWGEPAAREDRAAQRPRVGVLGASDPRCHAPLHGFAIDRPGAPAVAHAAQAVPALALLLSSAPEPSTSAISRNPTTDPILLQGVWRPRYLGASAMAPLSDGAWRAGTIWRQSDGGLIRSAGLRRAPGGVALLADRRRRR